MSENMQVLSVRLPADLKAALVAEAQRLRLRPTDVVRHTLAERLVEPMRAQKTQEVKRDEPT
jgi:hypothetical protein